MHPRQHPLEPEIEAIWLAAIEDAGLEPNECLLYVFDGAKSKTGYSGWHLQRGLYIHEEERILELLEARDEDSGGFRSHVGPAPIETLPERLLAFFMTHRDLCEIYAEQQGFRFGQLLDVHWNGAGAVWRQFIDEDGLAV